MFSLFIELLNNLLCSLIKRENVIENKVMFEYMTKIFELCLLILLPCSISFIELSTLICELNNMLSKFFYFVSFLFYIKTTGMNTNLNSKIVKSSRSKGNAKKPLQVVVLLHLMILVLKSTNLMLSSTIQKVKTKQTDS